MARVGRAEILKSNQIIAEIKRRLKRDPCRQLKSLFEWVSAHAGTKSEYQAQYYEKNRAKILAKRKARYDTGIQPKNEVAHSHDWSFGEEKREK